VNSASPKSTAQSQAIRASGAAKPAEAELPGSLLDDDFLADLHIPGLSDEEVAAGRILSQNEIDSLMGFDADPPDDEPRSTAARAQVLQGGIEAIVNSALVSYERLPMLEIVFDRLVRFMTGSLRSFTSSSVEVDIENISSVRFADYIDQIPVPTIISVFRAEEWDNYGLLTFNSDLVYALVDILLGGRRGAPRAIDIDGRPFTALEQRLIKRHVTLAMQDLANAFEPLAKVNFHLDRLETNPRFTAIDRPSNAAILVQFRIEFEKRSGTIELLLPHATLEPIRESLLQKFLGEKFGRDTIWEGHLAEELWSTRMELEAVLDECTMTLGDVRKFKTGQTLLFSARPDSQVDMRASGVSLFRGAMGRKNDHIAIRIESTLRELKTGDLS